jgi:hypothetical protein
MASERTGFLAREGTLHKRICEACNIYRPESLLIFKLKGKFRIFHTVGEDWSWITGAIVSKDRHI